MLFCELVDCNKDWQESTELNVYEMDFFEPVSMCARAARSTFAERRVLWFRNCVVVLE